METTDWKNLGFGYSKADFNVRCWYRNGQWGELEVSDSEYVTLHVAATTFHYGQEAFEGLKAFKGQDGKIRVFRMEENAKRMQRSSRGIMMAEVPLDLFTAAIQKVVQLNKSFVPPFDSGASLYVRPLLIGTGPQIGVNPSEEYLFMVMVMPVGPYFKEGFKPTDLVIYREYDRAAPLGTAGVQGLRRQERGARGGGFSQQVHVVGGDQEAKRRPEEAVQGQWIPHVPAHRCRRQGTGPSGGLPQGRA